MLALQKPWLPGRGAIMGVERSRKVRKEKTMYTQKEKAKERPERPDMLSEEEAVLQERLVVRYSLFTENGVSRAAYGTACAQIYSIRLRLFSDEDLIDESLLVDVARTEEEARALFARFVQAGVTPCTAADVMVDLLTCR